MSRHRDKDGGWAWVVLCACSVSVLMTSGLAMLAGMYQKVFLDEFGGDVVMTSWITSLFASLMQLAGPVTGVVCSVFSCRLSVMLGAVLLTAGLVASSFCENTTSLLLSFGISSGLGLGLIYSAAIVMVNLSFVHYRPVATGSVLAAGGVGIMVLPALCQYLLDAYSSRETLCIFSAMSAQLVVAGALLFPTSKSSSSDGGFCSTSTRQKLCTVSRRPALLLLCLQMFLTNAAIGIVLVHFPEFCLQSGSQFETVSLSFSMNGLTLTLSRFLMGFLSQDRNIDPLAVYVGLLVMTSFFMVVTALVAVTPNTQIALLSFIGLYFGGSYSLLTEITIHCTSVDTLSLAFGMEMISAGLGFLVAPPIAGWLVVLTDSYSDAILLAGFVNFLAVFVAMAISMTRPVWKPKETSDVTIALIPIPGENTTNSSSNNPTEHFTQQQDLVRQ